MDSSGENDMEKTSGKRKTETVLKLSATALLAAMLLVCPIWAAASVAADEGSQTVLPGENGQELVITVEGDEAAEEMTDINDQGVPLADSAGAAESAQTMHVIWAVIFFAGTVIYAAFFRSRQKKLFLLRRRAAEAEWELSHIGFTGIDGERRK